MQTAKLFMNGQSQAVRLPKEFRLEGSEVYIKKSGSSIVLIPANGSWDALTASLDAFSDDFMVERAQPLQQVRQELFE
jgi:antitoxin VapB